MKKILSFVLLSVLIPVFTFAYSVSGGTRSYSAPMRSYSAPMRSYSAPVRAYSAPVSSPTKSYTVTPSQKTYTAPVRTSVQKESVNNISNVSPSSYSGGYGYNPFSSNFLLWYWIFGGNNRQVQNINNHSTTTNATTTWNK